MDSCQKLVCKTQQNFAYWEMTKERMKLLNEKASNRIKSVLNSIPILEENLCISCVGSDGRLEKGHFSKLELLLIHNKFDDEFIKKIRNSVYEIKDENFNSLINSKDSEAKSIDDKMSYAFNNREIIYPSRILDSYFLFGNRDLLTKSRKILLDEFCSSEKQYIIKKIKSRKSEIKDIMFTGEQEFKGRKIKHYDLEQGISYFKNILTAQNGVDLQVRSFKMGPLRFVQVSIEHIFARIASYLITNKENSKLDIFLKELTTPVVEKLQLLFNMDYLKLSKNELSDSIDSYIFFLSLYHSSESNYLKGIQETEFCKEEVRERIKSLSEIFNGDKVKI